MHFQHLGYLLAASGIFAVLHCNLGASGIHDKAAGNRLNVILR
jgi:hypothetical protein